MKITRKQALKIVDTSLIDGTPLEDWWQRQAQDAQQGFMDAIRTAVQNDETASQAAIRVSDSLKIARNHADTLVKTSMNRIANEARTETLAKRDGVIGFQQISVLDSKTSDICISYSNAMWNLDFKPIRGTRLPFNGGPPRHMNCRSILIPIVKGEAPAGDITFDEFLKSKTPAQQNKILGKGKARLWRKGKITLKQLVDMRGNPLTLGQLEAKIAKRSRK